MLSAIAFACLLSVPESVRLQFVPPVGKVYRYAIETRNVPDGVLVKQEASVRVLSRVGALSTVEAVVRSAGGGAEAKTLTKVNGRRLLQGELASTGYKLEAAVPGVSGIMFPRTPVHVGQKWTGAIDVLPMVRSMAGPKWHDGRNPVIALFQLDRIENGVAHVRVVW